MCPNVCHVAGEEHRRATEADRKLRRTGAKIRSTYIAFAQKEKSRLEASIASLSAELGIRKTEEAKLKGAFTRLYFLVPNNVLIILNRNVGACGLP